MPPASCHPWTGASFCLATLLWFASLTKIIGMNATWPDLPVLVRLLAAICEAALGVGFSRNNRRALDLTVWFALMLAIYAAAFGATSCGCFGGFLPDSPLFRALYASVIGALALVIRRKQQIE